MNIDIENIIRVIVKEVVSELNKRGIEIKTSGKYAHLFEDSGSTEVKGRMEFDLKGYATPVLTGERLEKIEPGIREIIVPRGTVLTPGAREIIRKEKLIIINK